MPFLTSPNEPSLNSTLLVRHMKYPIIHVILLSGNATHTEIYGEIARGLEAKYPNHILPKRDREWMFINSGGWMASVYLMHASLTEYVQFMGTAMQTSGHGGIRMKYFSVCVLAFVLVDILMGKR